MRWTKHGRIYTPESKGEWGVTHAQLPTVDQISGDRLRIYYGTRDRFNRTVTTFIETDADEPSRIQYIHDEPVLRLGDLGCFDDGGVMPSWIVSHNGLKYLYYIGWNAGISVSYRNAIGVAVSDDGGRHFTRLYKGPIVDRSPTEPHFCGASCVLIENGLWRMWYLRAIGWLLIDGKTEPVYHIRYGESKDGIEWDRRGVVAIELQPHEGGITRPCVLRCSDGYKMWYSYRGLRDYRSNKSYSYRIGYAESGDGIAWRRNDDAVGIDISPNGWDSEMITYAHVYRRQGCTCMIYNGNGFGRSGFGYAVMS